MIILYTDGASRKNPGLSGIGFVFFKNNEIINQQSFFLGICTNNVVELSAIIIGLYIAKYTLFCNNITIRSDSLLIINQCKKIYKVKDCILKKGHDIIKHNFSDMNIIFEHIDRSNNQIADMLANRGIDEKKFLPEKIKHFMGSFLFS